jgi:hypothetical protein
MIFGHHAQGFLQSMGLDIDVNGKPFPDGPAEHVIALIVLLVMAVLMSYGAFAMVRDFLRWRRREPVKA